MGSPAPQAPNKSLYVRGLREDTTQSDIRELFSRHGHVTDIYIPISYYNKRPRGFAYVAFETIEDSKRALRKLDGSTFLGREIKVEFAQGERKTPGEMRAKETRDTRYGDRGPPPRRGGYGDRFDHGGHSNGRGRSRSPPYGGRGGRRSRSPVGRPVRRSPSPRPRHVDYAEPRGYDRPRYAGSPPRRDYAPRTRTPPPPEEYRGSSFRGGRDGAGRDGAGRDGAGRDGAGGNGYAGDSGRRSDYNERSFDRHHGRERGTPPPDHYRDGHRSGRRSVSE